MRCPQQISCSHGGGAGYRGRATQGLVEVPDAEPGVQCPEQLPVSLLCCGWGEEPHLCVELLQRQVIAHCRQDVTSTSFANSQLYLLLLRLCNRYTPKDSNEP